MADVASQTAENELENLSLKEFSERVSSDPDLNSRYLKNPNSPEFTRFNEGIAELVEKYGEKWSDHLDDAAAGSTPGSQDQAQQSSQGEGAGKPVDVSGIADDAEIDVTVKIPKSLFGTYLTNRTPDQAILEALKGNKEKDATIQVLRSQHTATHEENLSLRNRVKAAMMAQPSIPQPTQEVLNVADMDVESVDFLDPDEQERVKKGTRAMAEFVKKVQQAQPAVDPNKAKESINKLDEEAEYAEIRQLQVDDPTLATSIDFATLDRSVVAFVGGIQRVSGLSKAEAWALYNDPQKGEVFKAQCAASGVVMPSEIDKHSRIMAARSQILQEVHTRREKEAARMTSILRSKGRLSADEAVSVDEVERPSYASVWKDIVAQQARSAPPPAVPPSATPAPAPQSAANPALQAQIDAKRAQQEQQSVPLIPPGMPAPVVDIAQVPEAVIWELNAKFNKDPESLTNDEAQLFARAHEHLKVPLPPALKRKLKI